MFVLDAIVSILAGALLILELFPVESTNCFDKKLILASFLESSFSKVEILCFNKSDTNCSVVSPSSPDLCALEWHMIASFIFISLLLTDDQKYLIDCNSCTISLMPPSSQFNRQ